MSPVWIGNQEFDHCAVCASQFSTFTLRRHHCRACGCLVCRVCSRGRSKLAFVPYRPCRVCDNCHVILEHKVQRSLLGTSAGFFHAVKTERFPLDDSLLSIGNVPLYAGVNGTALSLEVGFMSGSRDKVTWVRRWYSLHKNGVLFTFDGPDSSALSAMIIHEYQLCVSGGSFQSPADVECYSFAIIHRQNRTVFFFNAETKEQFVRWCNSLGQFVELLDDDVSTVRPNDVYSVIDAMTEFISTE